MSADKIVAALDKGLITMKEAAFLIHAEFELALDNQRLKVGKKLLSKRIIAKTSDPIMGTPCWLYSGTHKQTIHGTKSYPMFYINSKQSPVHAVRAGYRFLLDIEPPTRESGMTVSHLCQTGAPCWRMDHTIIESFTANLARRDKEALRKQCEMARAHIQNFHHPSTWCKRGHLMAETRTKWKKCGLCEFIYQIKKASKDRQNTWRKKALRKLGLVMGETWICEKPK